uniref:uncharacterized protein ccdc14 n=1 Tax=Scatophagus argus TaxID=75038 RepID=UPI001ED81F4F|nr:uncharacterized protein ccdc14 [Scatophagus argus]
MKEIAKSKAVTSGRLTGRAKVQPARRRAIRNPGPALCPEPAYSLYSTDSEDQVTSLHKGLDQCAALLSGILQVAGKAEALPGLPREVKSTAAKSRKSASPTKKTIKKLYTQTEQKSGRSVQRGPGSTAPIRHQSTAPPAHSGVRLHPPQKQLQTLLQSPSHCQTLPIPSTPKPHPQTSIPPTLTTTSPPQTTVPPPQINCQSACKALHTHCNTEWDRKEEDFVPVRDVSAQSTATDTHTAVGHTHSHIHTCTFKMSDMQLGPGEADKVPQDTDSREDYSAEKEGTLKTVQYLLGELKTLIAGQGSVAKMLLSHLEQTVSSPLNAGGSNIQTEPHLSSLHSQNTQLWRIQNQQLKEEKAQRQQNMETPCNSEALALQEELNTARLQLQELRDELAELQEALQDTQSQLRDREAKNTLIKSDLDATRSRLLDSEREKSELASLARQRLEEIEHLNRALQRQNSSDFTTAVDSSVSDTLTKQHFEQHQHGLNPAEPPADRITQYVMSLGQLEPTYARHLCVAAEGERNTLEQNKLTSVQLRDALSHSNARAQQVDKLSETSALHQNTHPTLNQSHCLDKVQSCGRWLHKELDQLPNSKQSQCDVESVCSDWSMRSGSTFDTRDEAVFRDGLSALDASIASLQKSIQLDLWK